MKEFSLAYKEAFQLVKKIGNREWYITDRGRVIAVPSNLNEKKRGKALMEPRFEVKPRVKRIKEKPGIMLMVDIGNSHLVLKTMVIRAFSDAERYISIRSNHQVQHKNNDALDCSLGNLVLYSVEEAKDLGLFKRWKIEITYSDGKVVNHPSLIEAALSIPCDRSTLYDYLHGKTQKSCCHSNGIVQIRRVRTEDKRSNE